MPKIFESLSRWNTTEEFGLQVARGQVAGHRVVHVFGYNPDIDTGVEETIWTFGGIYQHLPSPQIVTVSSGSANDTAAGTGARTVLVTGINGTGGELSETVTLNGQTAVNTTHEYSEINSVTVLTVGSVGHNVGQIYIGTGTVTLGVPANVYSHILAGENQSLMGHYQIPAGHTGYVLHGNISSGTPTNGYVIGRLKIRTADGVTRTGALVTFYSGEVDYDFPYPITIPAGACVSATALTTKDNEQVSCYFQILVIKNENTTY